MNDLLSIMHNPTRVLYVYVAVWSLSALAHTMPAPDAKSGKVYQWVFNLLQFLLANLNRLRSITAKSAEPLSQGLVASKLALPVVSPTGRDE